MAPLCTLNVLNRAEVAGDDVGGVILARNVPPILDVAVQPDVGDPIAGKRLELAAHMVQGNEDGHAV